MSAIEEEFAWQLSTILVNPAREFRAIPERKFRWDFAFPEKRLLIEIQGGTWSEGKMAHNSGPGIRRDCEKLNLAQIDGWRVLHFTTDMVKDGSALTIVERMVSV